MKEGQAVAYVAYSKAYVDEEESAAAAKKGVWSAKGFQKPWDYRKARKEEGRERLCRSYDHYTRSHDRCTRACCASSAMQSGGRGCRWVIGVDWIQLGLREFGAFARGLLVELGGRIFWIWMYEWWR